MATNVVDLPAITLVCPQCGTEAACLCGAKPITRAEYALLKNPEKSDRAIAAGIGVGNATVSRARRKAKATVSRDTVDKRVGRDGKARKQPKPKSKAMKTRSKATFTPRPGMNTPPELTDPIQEPCDDCANDEERWQRSCANMLGELLSLRPYWKREFGAWEKFEVPTSLATLAKQALKEMSELAKHLTTS